MKVKLWWPCVRGHDAYTQGCYDCEVLSEVEAEERAGGNRSALESNQRRTRTTKRRSLADRDPTRLMK